MEARAGQWRHRRAAALALVCVAALAITLVMAFAPAAHAASLPSPWDGSNPFVCVIQDAGTGTSVPDPGADPYCVRFDKTHQNVDQLGIVDFLSKEPARTAAASPKCFYFQEDHWRASVIQSNGKTVLYEWVGHYFFNKATGDGGAWVSGFSVGGQTADPTELPGFPPQYAPYFGPGTGGFITHDDVPVDPVCAARAQQNPASIYAYAANQPRCVPGAGHVTRRRVGPLTLHLRENQIRAELGPPGAVKRGFLHYCVEGGGQLLIGQPGDRSGTFGTGGQAKTVILLTTSKKFVWHRPRSLSHARRLMRLGRLTIVQLRARDMIVALSRGRVVYVGIYNRRAIRTLRVLRSYLLRARR